MVATTALVVSDMTETTPAAVLGDVAGAPGILPYSADVNRYMRMLALASRRVKVVSIGHSEEGREMIAVAISSEENLAHLDENRARLAKLGDPRMAGADATGRLNLLDDAAADRLISASVPVYYITGALHSDETGAPTALNVDVVIDCTGPRRDIDAAAGITLTTWKR